MPPRSQPLPTASTASAKAARAAFLCELCQKQYTRQNELEAHESSYDHLHKKRLKEMKSLQGKMAMPTKKDRDGGEGVLSIKLGAGGGKEKGKDWKESGGGGFKKGGFKNAFAPVGGEEEGEERKVEREEKTNESAAGVLEGEDSDVTDQEDYYDPSRPTGCMPGCPGRVEIGHG